MFISLSYLTQRGRLCLFALLLLRVAAHAQQPSADSLAWKAQFDYAQKLMRANPDSAVIVANRAIALAKQHPGTKGIRLLRSYGIMCNIYGLVAVNPSKALAYSDTALSIADAYNQPLKKAGSYEIQAHAYKALGRFEQAMDKMLAAVRLRETPPVDSLALGRTLTNLGVLYTLGAPQAIAAFRRADAVLPAHADRADIRFNLANQFYHAKQYDSAIQIFREVIQYWHTTNDLFGVGQAESNLANTFMHVPQYDSARVHLNRSLEVFRKMDLPAQQSNALSLLANSYMRENKPQQALAPFREAVALHDSSQWEFKVSLFQTGADIYEQLGDYKQAYHYLQRMAKAREQYLAFEERRQADIARENYDLEKRDRQIAALAIAEARKTSQRNLAFGGAGVLLVLLVAGYVLLRNRQKLHLQRAELAHSIALNEQQEADRRQLAGELHDGVAQDLMLLRQTLVQANHPDLAQQADASIDLLRTTARFLYPASLDQTGLQSALYHLLSQWEAKTPVFLSYDFEYPTGWVPQQAEIHLYRFVQEAVTNALKHANPKAISIEMEKTTAALRVLIRDNGQGFDSSAALSRPSSFGLLSLQHRAKQLGGSLAIDSQLGRGTTLTLNIPAQQS